MLLLISSETTV